MGKAIDKLSPIILLLLLSGKFFLLDKIRADTSNEVSALLVTFAFEFINHSHFTGQPVYSQVLKLLDKGKILQISRNTKGSEAYVKRFDGYQHLVVMLFGVLKLLLSAKHDLSMPNLFITSGWAYLFVMTSPLIHFPPRLEALQLPVQA